MLPEYRQFNYHSGFSEDEDLAAIWLVGDERDGKLLPRK